MIRIKMKRSSIHAKLELLIYVNYHLDITLSPLNCKMKQNLLSCNEYAIVI